MNVGGVYVYRHVYLLRMMCAMKASKIQRRGASSRFTW